MRLDQWDGAAGNAFPGAYIGLSKRSGDHYNGSVISGYAEAVSFSCYSTEAVRLYGNEG